MPEEISSGPEPERAKVSRNVMLSFWSFSILDYAYQKRLAANSHSQ